MTSAWNLFKRIGQKKLDEFKESPSATTPRIDRELPLGLRVNGMVEVSEVDFILGGADLKVKHPGSSNTVLSYGTFTVGDSTVNRFYLDAEDHPYVLQIVVDSKNIIEECKLFMPFDEIYPQRSEDWGFWLAEEDGYIGYSVFQTKDNTQYSRVWENEGAEVVLQEDEGGNRLTRIPPLEFTETIYMDAYGKDSETVTYQSMLYGRQVNPNVDEYLLLSAVEEKDGASIQIMVGLELAPASIKVI